MPTPSSWRPIWTATVTLTRHGSGGVSIRYTRRQSAVIHPGTIGRFHVAEPPELTDRTTPGTGFQEDATSELRYSVLGPLEVTRQQTGLDLGGPLPRALLTALLVEPGRSISMDALVETMWPTTPPVSARKIVQKYVSQLRKMLGPTLVTTRTGYLLEVDRDHVDSARFEQLVEEARHTAPEHAAVLLDRALGMWRGTPYEDVDAPGPTRAERARLEELRLQAAEYLNELDLLRGRSEVVIERVEKLVAANPWRERLWGQLMVGLNSMGRQADALQAYQRLRLMLASELGLMPSAEVQDLERRILAQDPTLISGKGPTGDGPSTKTFMFADIEGSTGLLSELGPEPYSELLSGYHRILDDNVARFRGIVINRAGDGAFAIFAGAADALVAAAAIAGSIRHREWPDNATVRVRIGVHTGDAYHFERTGYVSPEIHRAARLAEAAWGGQILLSDTTWDLARERMPVEFGSIDLGRHHLDGFAESIRLHQLIHPDLAGEFPRPRAIRDAMTNLPARLTTFVGRGQELDEIGTLQRRARLVTLTGPGGAGKTRLAQETAARLIGEFADGVWFIDLAPLTSPDRVSAAFARPLGVSGQPGRETEAVLLDYCSSRELLLVIDNCEHLIERTAMLVSELLQSATGLRVLATSREALGVPGEAIYEIGPLPVPNASEGGGMLDYDSVRLFLDRAPHLIDPGPADLEAIGRICRRLDGMPLALELAAARARSFSPPELADLLDDRFAVLAVPERGRPARHQTLHATVAWSYELLSEPARLLFRRLSVFRGGFDVAALRAVCGSSPLDPGGAPGLLAELTEKSLVVAQLRAARYRLLETLREFGQQMLTPNEAQEVRTWHARHYTTLADGAAINLRGSGQAEAMALLTNDLDNLRKALRWSFAEMPETGIRLATSLAEYWDAAGPRGEAHEWLRRAVELSDQVAPVLRIAARLAASDLFVSSDLSHSERYATEALNEARAIGDELATARSLRALGWARGLQEEPEEAIRLCEEALAIFERLDETWESAWCLERMAQSDYRDPVRSLTTYQESLARFRTVGDERRAGLVLYKMAERNIQAAGDMATAESWVRESLEIAERLGSTHDVAHARRVLGWVLRMRGRYGQARGVLEVALSSLLKVGDQRCAVRAMSALGHVLLDTGDPSAAGAMLRQSLEVGLEEGTYVRASIDGLGRLAELQGRLKEAAMMYAAAHKLRERLRLPATDATVVARADRFERLRQGLGESAFQDAWTQGSNLTPDEVVALAFIDP